ncbi:MAG: thioredoxin domain-containing protein, partial [Chloroflexota bacterium]
WREQRGEIERVGSQVLQHIQVQPQAKEKNIFTSEMLEAATKSLLDSYDWQYGGWGGSPKFPQPMALGFLLRRAAGRSHQGKMTLKAVRHALDAMSRGGMFDVVGGGFARYSMDNSWRTPHFEKMLYDNAQLALAYLHGFLVTGEHSYRQVCEQTLDFLLREMSHPDGGFYSSLDADSEGEEGKFYVWTQAELESALGPDFEFFQAAYGVTAQGNWEGRTILQRALDDGSLAALFPSPSVRAATDLEPVRLKLAECHTRLLAVREKRVRPATDDKILVSWNALALLAFAEAGRYLGRKDYLEAAVRNARFLLKNLYAGGRLLRSWREGRAKHNAYLEDYAALALALLALYQSDPNPEWYAAALKLADEMVAHFTDPAGGFFDTRDDHEPLPVRPKDMQDNATPSGNALAALALLQLAAYGDRLEWRDLAEEMLAKSSEMMERYPLAFAQWLCAADFALSLTHEVAVLGESDEPAMKALVETLWKTYRPHLVAAISPYPPPSGSPALLKDRPLLNSQPTAYVCQGFVCRQPVNAPDELESQLSG